jgi:hypothetical protein
MSVRIFIYMLNLKNNKLLPFYSYPPSSPSPLDMGRGDVPTRGSDWYVKLEICVGVIYCKGWFRVALGQRIYY